MFPENLCTAEIAKNAESSQRTLRSAVTSFSQNPARIRQIRVISAIFHEAEFHLCNL